MAAIDTDNAGGKQLTPPRCSVAHCWVDQEIYEELVLQAQRRRMHPDALAAELLIIVIERRLVGDVLEARGHRRPGFPSRRSRDGSSAAAPVPPPQEH